MSVASEASVRARRLYRSEQCRAAYIAGARARERGAGADACPHAPDAGRPTWRTALRRAWERGYDSLDANYGP